MHNPMMEAYRNLNYFTVCSGQSHSSIIYRSQWIFYCDINHRAYKWRPFKKIPLISPTRAKTFQMSRFSFHQNASMFFNIRAEFSVFIFFFWVISNTDTECSKHKNEWSGSGINWLWILRNHRAFMGISVSILAKI